MGQEYELHELHELHPYEVTNAQLASPFYQPQGSSSKGMGRVIFYTVLVTSFPIKCRELD